MTQKKGRLILFDMKEFERILKALANRRRLEIVRHLKKNKEANVGAIAEAIKLSIKSTSRHISVLSSADTLEKEQRGTLVFYRLSGVLPKIAKAIIALI